MTPVESTSTWTRRLSHVLGESELRRALRSGHIPMPVHGYLRSSLIATGGTACVCAAAFVILGMFGYGIRILDLPVWATEGVLFVCLVSVVFAGFYGYPFLLAQGRKTKIDLDLPYTITYMQALSTTMTLYQVIRKVYEDVDLFGEISKEFGLVVRDVELFGDDLHTAMRNLQLITPSANFRDLLNDLIMISNGGGDLTAFLASRSANFREIAAREMEMVMKTIEIMAEVYVTAFVAGPIAIIIMIVAENLAGQSQLSGWMPLIYLGITVGALIMIALLAIMLPTENLEINRKETAETEYWEVRTTPLEQNVDDRFLRRLKSVRQQTKFRQVLHHPFRYYIADYTYAYIAAALCGLAVTLLFLFGPLRSLVPSNTAEIFLALLIIAVAFPIALAYEGRRWYVTHIEFQMPEFLRELADMKDIGLTLQGAISRISTAKLGLLSSELRIVTEDLRSGSSVTNALRRMEQRIGLISVKRAISLVVKASEITDFLRDILLIAISDFEHYLKLKQERFTTSFAYVAIIYLSFFIFLYTAYQLNVSFVSSFQKFDIPLGTASNLTDMFRISILLGAFSGLMAGQLSGNSILSGLKHTIFLLIVSVVMFAVVIASALGGAA